MRRQEIGANGDPGKSNDDTFLSCYEELQRGGIILIFGEGTSHLEPRLMPLKTGAARIALGAEQRFGPLGVRLIPVGLNYEAPELFGQRVRVCFSDPLPALPFLNRAGDAREAARQLTRLVEACLEKEIVHLDDQEFEDVLVTVDSWIGHRLVSPERHRLDVMRAIADVLNHFNERDPDRVKAFQSSLRDYHQLLSSKKLNDEMLEDQTPIGMGTYLRALLAFPFWLWGAANHFIPYQIPRIVCARLNFHPTYSSTIKLLTGVLSFGLCYGLQSWLVFHFAGLTAAWTYLVTLPIFGMIALAALQYYEGYKKRHKLAMELKNVDSEDISKAKDIRHKLMEALESAEKEVLEAH
jgi:hypothetical protein